MAEGVSRKWVELLKEVLPKARRLAVLWDSRLAAHATMWREVQVAGQALGVTPLFWEARGPDEFERAFAAMGTERIGGLIILPYPVAGQNRRLILDLAAKHRLPAIYPFREFTEAGCLMSYGPNNVDLYRRAAHYVDKILKGAKPGELPVEQPTTFELVINLKTAKALGLTIPQSILIRADEVIQ
jgi:putative ABC transport system substrate-binding protein